MNYACIFPGQGSQAVGMMADLFERYPVVNETFDAASQIVGVNLARLALKGPAEELNRTIHTQPVVLSASVAMWRVWRDLGAPLPKIVCGHSLGEYSALVCADAIRFDDAARLVRRRAELMEEAVADTDAGMAAVLGIDADTLTRMCETLARDEVASGDGVDATLEAVNYNSPEQTVVAGHTRMLRKLAERLATEFADNRRVKCVPLPVSVPSHSSLMQAAARTFGETLSAIDIQMPAISVLHNFDAKPRATADEIRAALTAQLHHPVQWVNTQERLKEAGLRACVEMGPGAVLAGLMKRVNRNMPCYGMNTASDINVARDALAQPASA